MGTVYSTLAAKQYLEYLPLIVGIACGVILVIAFLIGMKKGARKVSWSGFVWIFAGVAFFLIDKYLGAKNPLLKWLTNKGFATGVVAFASSLSIALVCILFSLGVYGICSLIFRPRVKWVKKEADRYTKDENGVEYDEDYEDYDDYEEYEDRKVPVRKGYGTPSVAGRITGGIICAINTAMVLLVVIASLLFLVNSTKLKDGAFSAMYSVPFVRTFLKFATRWAFDLAIIGIIIGVACAGRRKGFVETLRVLIVNVGSIVLVGLCFWVPFSKFAQVGGNSFFYTLVSRCTSAITALGASAKVSAIVAKILSGVLLAALAVVAVVLLNLLLRLAVRGIDKVEAIRAIDGVFAALLYLVIGVAVCALIWAIMYVLSYYGIFKAGGLFTGETCLSKGLFDTFDVYLKPWIEKLTKTLSGWMSKV